MNVGFLRGEWHRVEPGLRHKRILDEEGAADLFEYAGGYQSEWFIPECSFIRGVSGRIILEFDKGDEVQLSRRREWFAMVSSGMLDKHGRLCRICVPRDRRAMAFVLRDADLLEQVARDLGTDTDGTSLNYTVDLKPKLNS